MPISRDSQTLGANLFEFAAYSATESAAREINIVCSLGSNVADDIADSSMSQVSHYYAGMRVNRRDHLPHNSPPRFHMCAKLCSQGVPIGT